MLNETNLSPAVGLIGELKDLKKKPELNGRKGTLLQKIASTGRFQFKDILSGKSSLVKADNLIVKDELIEFLKQRNVLIDQHICNVFADQFRKSVKEVTPFQSWNNERKSFLIDSAEKVGMQIKKLGESVIILVQLTGLGHEFLLEILRVDIEEIEMDTHKEKDNQSCRIFLTKKLEKNNVLLSGRIVQCWIKNFDSKGKVFTGFTVGDWIANKQTNCNTTTNGVAKFGWMHGMEFKKFCDNMDKLRQTIDNIVEQDLIPYASQFCNTRDLHTLKMWAWNEGITNNHKNSGFSMVIRKLSDVDPEVAGGVIYGYPGKAVVFAGRLEGNPKQLLVFPEAKYNTLNLLVLQLFGIEVPAISFLSMIAMWHQPEDWRYQVIEIGSGKK